MDQFDGFLADLLMEGVKSSTGSVRGVMDMDDETPSRKNRRARLRIPRPRSTRQLVRDVTPQIKSVASGTEGHRVASEAWEVCLPSPRSLLIRYVDV